MLIEYCDKCGMRVPEKEIQERHAVRLDERLYCAKCCPAPASRAMPKQKHTSEAKIVLAAPRPAQHPISDGSLKAHARGARTNDPRSGRTVRQEGLSKPMLAGILAAVAGVLLLAVVFMSGGKPDQAHNARPDVPDIPTASENPPSAPSAAKTAAVRKPDPPRTATVVPLAGANLSPAGSSREGQAEKAYAELLAGIADRNADARKTKLKEFIESYQDTIVAARARVELARLESPQPGHASPVSHAAGGKTYVLQQGLDGYAGCEDTFLYTYHPKMSKFKEIELSCGRGIVPVLHFAIFKSEGGPVPDGAKIISARLDLERPGGDPMELNVYPLLKDCQLAAATWEEAAPGLAWEEAGAAAKGKDYGSEPLATLPVGRDMTALEFDLTEGVRKLAGGEKNRGWVLHGGAAPWNYYRILSSENAATDKRPKLTVVVAGDASAAAAAPAEGLVLYLPFDEKAGSVATDVSGAGNNAQIAGAPEWQDGKFGGALHLNGRDCRVVLGRLAVNTQPGAKNTVSMWVRFGQFENMLFSWAGRGALYFGRGNFGFNTQSSDILGIPCMDLALHEWIHLVAVFPNDIPNEQNATLYLNGKRVAIAQVVGRPKESQATSDATIGVMFKPTNYHIDATVDEFRLYNRELSEAEAAALYAAGTGAPAQPAPVVEVATPAPVPADGDGLVLHLPFKKPGDEFKEDLSDRGCKVELKNGATALTTARGYALNLPRGQAFAEVEGLAVDTQPGAKNTVVFWMYARDIGSAMPFAWKGQNYCMYLNTTGFGFNTGEAGNILGVDSTRIKPKEWVHVAAVFPNGVPSLGTVALYLNGERAEVKLVSAPLPTRSVSASSGAYLGGIPTGDYYFDGVLQDVRVYNRELNAEEVKAVFANKPLPPRAASSEQPSAAGGLVLHLPLNSRRDDFAKDASGNGCDATFFGGAHRMSGANGPVLNLGQSGYAQAEGIRADTRPGGRNTVTLRMYVKSIGNGMPFAWKDQSYCLLLNKDGFGINTGEAGNILGVDSSFIKEKTEIHVAAVFPNGKPDLTNIALYLDGKRVESKLVAGAMPTLARSASNGIYLGNLPSGRYPFSGHVSDVRVYSYELSTEEIKAVFENRPLPTRSAAVPAPTSAVDKDLVLYLPFDEKSGDVAKDASGNGHNATLKGGPQFEAGKIGGALRFDGTDDYAEFADFDYGPEFTLAFWFNMDQRPGARYQYLFGHGIYDKTNSCLVYVDQEEKKLRTYLRDANDGHIIREYDIPYDGLGNWTHYAVQVSREEGIKMFLDGKLLKTGRHGKKGVNPQTSMTLGIRWDFDRERIFKGALDDLRLYNRALSDEEIAALAEGNAPAIAAAPQLSAEDQALDGRLKRWRVLWGAGETKSLRDDMEALRKEGGAAAEQAAVGEAALAARDAAWKQATMLQGKALRLALATGETQAGKIERLDGERFEFNLGGLVTRYQLGDLAWETFRGWAEAQMTSDEEKQKKLTAAALLTAGVDAEKEADAALRAAWGPLFASAGRVDANWKNDAVWAEILGLVKAQKWQEVNEKAQGLLAAPPGGLLSAELKEKIEKLLADSKSSIQAELSKPENLPLQVRAKSLEDGKIELRYDFSNPRQLQDFEGLDANFMRIEGGALNLSAMQIRHKLSFEGDLSIAYDAASTATKPHRLYMAFYDLRGEIGYESKDETVFWQAFDPPGKVVKVNPLIGKQWNRIDIQYMAATKQTRIAVNGTECMNSTNLKSAGKGHFLLAAYQPYMVRNLVISGKPAPGASETILRNRAFAEALQKKLAQGEAVAVFTAEDQGNWDMGIPDSWQFASGVANGEGTLLLPGLALRDYEAEMDVRLVGADKFRVVVRQGPKDRHHVMVTPRGVSLYVTDRLASYTSKEVGKPNNADGKAWHHLTIQSKGSAMKIVLDGKEVLFDDQQLGTDSMGFYFQTEGGKAAIKNITVKALR